MRWQKRLKRVGEGAKNALELMRAGRLSAPYQAPHEVLLEQGFLRLRRYGLDQNEDRQEAAGAAAIKQPILLIPPLMVTAEIYDISPELSAVSWLDAQGVDVWVVDFGSPEEEEGGMERSLDDHILAIDKAVTYVSQVAGAPVHLAGYSQGGMFAYMVAAYRKNADLASVITFGSPVDMRKNLPVPVKDDAATRIISAATGAVSGVLERIEGLPAMLTSRGFKLASPKKEIQQIIQMFGLLHDREALEKREPKRRFLGGEGFIGFPGPALRDLVTDLIASNRLTTGGVVINGRTISLHDMTVPVLYFVGTADSIARPASVRAIADVAGSQRIHELGVKAGHFGLVVGSRAMSEVWPTVAEWISWHSGSGGMPKLLAAESKAEDVPVKAPEPPPTPVSMLYDIATDMVDGLWGRVSEVSKDVVSVVDAMRWQLPRLAKLASIEDRSRVSIGRALAEQAAAIPDAPFFLWQGRAFTYREADEYVNRLMHALYEKGVRPGQHVGVLMDNHPDYIAVVAATSRLGAVSVLLSAEARGASLDQALGAGAVDVLVAGPHHVEAALGALRDKPVLLLGSTRGQGPVPVRAVDLDPLVDPAHPPAPMAEGFRPNPGRAADVAILMYTSGTTGMPKAARITNRRWVMAALGSAAACSLTPRDTVYCCLPLHHATAMLVACGGALVGGARLALAPRFSPSTFSSDLRRTGANVVFYVGELCRYIVTIPASAEKQHAVRLFVGTGMRPDVWQKLLDRYPRVRVIEFYGSTEGNIALVNLTGEKVGSVGREMMSGQGELPRSLALVRYDVETGRPVRGQNGFVERCPDGEPGLLIARIKTTHPLGHFDGYTDAASTEQKILRDAFEQGDLWFDSGDLLRRDVEGDYWFVDRMGDTFRWKGENVSTEQVAAVLGRASEVAFCTVYGITLPGHEGRAGMAALELRPGHSFDGAELYSIVEANLSPAARPRFLRIVDRLETTDTLKFKKLRLAEEGADPARLGDAIYHFDETSRAYLALDAEKYRQVVEQL